MKDVGRCFAIPRRSGLQPSHVSGAFSVILAGNLWSKTWWISCKMWRWDSSDHCLFGIHMAFISLRWLANFAKAPHPPTLCRDVLEVWKKSRLFSSHTPVSSNISPPPAPHTSLHARARLSIFFDVWYERKFCDLLRGCTCLFNPFSRFGGRGGRGGGGGIYRCRAWWYIG